MNVKSDDPTGFRGDPEREWPHDTVVIFHDDGFARDEALRFCRQSERMSGDEQETVHQSWTLDELTEDSSAHLAWLETSRAERVILSLSAGHLRPEWREALENWMGWAAGRVRSLVILSATGRECPAMRLVAAKAAESGVTCEYASFLQPPRPWRGRSSRWGINE